MLPVIADIQRFVSQGGTTHVVLPADAGLARLFENSNWAHFLSPSQHAPRELGFDRHLPLRRFSTPSEQAALVDRLIDVIMRVMVLDRTSLGGIEWVLSEITDNVLNHADSTIGGLAQLAYYTQNKRIAFCVVDAGRGIFQSLREGFPLMGSDLEAVQQAVRTGVTRNKSVGQGNGLTGAQAIALSAQEGQFRIVSGDADILWKPGPLEEIFPMSSPFHGTLVDVQFSTAQPIELNRIIGESTRTPNYEHADTIELKYTSHGGSELIIRVIDEAVGRGTRIAGRQMRTKCSNLMHGEPGCVLVIDWSDVQVVSSSFADEFVGKLFFEIGPTRFMARVRNINMNATVGQLIDRAILQRTQQEMENGTNGAG